MRRRRGAARAIPPRAASRAGDDAGGAGVAPWGSRVRVRTGRAWARSAGRILVGPTARAADDIRALVAQQDRAAVSFKGARVDTRRARNKRGPARRRVEANRVNSGKPAHARAIPSRAVGGV